MKNIILYTGIFILGFFVGWFFYELFLSLFNTTKVVLIFRSPSELLFNKLKVAGLFGLTSVAIALGTIVPKTLNGIKRFLIITLPTLAICGIAFVAKRALMDNVIEIPIPNFVNQPTLAVVDLKIEHVPFSGLLTAIVIIVFLFARSGQQTN